MVALIQGMNLSIGWLGDSQIVLCKAGDAIQLMEPHKPDRQVYNCVQLSKDYLFNVTW